VQLSPSLPVAAILAGVVLQAVACLTIGAAVAVLTLTIAHALQSGDLAQGAQWRYDISRINELRRVDPFYRLFQPFIRGLAWLNRALFRESLPAVQREIQAAGLPRFWLAEEYLARLELLALFTTPAFVYSFMVLFGPSGLVPAIVAVPLLAWLLRRRLASMARYRLRQIKRRLPFLLDLLTLLMQVGATFLGALGQAIEEFRGHPVAEEFGRVLADMSLGKTRAEAFSALRDRLADDEITSIVGSILQGEQLGTPLAHIFHTQADVLRIKRTQRAETVAGEAGVNMLLPGVLIMAATVIIILGPFLLNYLTVGLML
jgi:tight adherence protein C